mgnify:CR=1 FL=1
MWYYGGRIRIEPDWNVKCYIAKSWEPYEIIRIEPDWNVKLSEKSKYTSATLLE